METTINNLLGTPAINAIVVNYHDITDRIKYQEALEELNQTLEERVADRTQQLERANKELEAFTYSVSHDLRAPLRAIIGFGKVLERDNRPDLKPEGARMLQVIMDNSKKMGQLIDDLLEFSRLGRREQKNYLFDTNELVNEIIKAQFTQIGPLISIKVNPLPEMYADRAMMALVYTNLISNAVKYSSIDKPNQIEIGCTIGNKENVFYISDTGVGFDMKYKDKLFGVFQRLHSAREFEGTGVGLALAHRIILRHGGNIWAESKVNHGATFYFTISQNQPL
jgi:light-regulated signal transduction histidine kinase (bacteriophytochrome)